MQSRSQHGAIFDIVIFFRHLPIVSSHTDVTRYNCNNQLHLRQ
jgi:hypothetical protein